MSFKLKTILGIAFIEVIVLAILVSTSLNDLRQSNARELFSRAQTTVTLLSTMTSDAVLSADLATLDSFIDETLANEGLLYIRILNDGGVALSEGGAEEYLKADFIEDVNGFAAKDQRIDVSAPIQVGGVVFGQVQIGLSTHLLDNVVAAGTQRMLAIAAIEVVLVAIFGYFLGSILTKQLVFLQKQAHRVASGDFGNQLDFKGKDEIAQTIQSFNKMSSALKSYSDEVETARVQAEARRDLAETLLNVAMNSVEQAIFITDRENKVAYANNAARELYELSKDAIAGGVPFETVTQKMRLADDHSTQSIDGKSEERTFRELSKELGKGLWYTRHQDGRIILLSKSPLKDSGAVFVETDVTKLFNAQEKVKQLEIELLHTHKLEALGTLASGVAHEINTPTQFINDNVHFLSQSFSDLVELAKIRRDSDSEDGTNTDWDFIIEEVPTAISDTLSGIESISKIVNSIRDFSHPDNKDMQKEDLRRIIETSTTISKSQWKHIADLSIDIQCEDTSLTCYAGDISQLLINLIVNAADAIRDASPPIDAPEISVILKRTPSHVILEIHDNGPGIHEDKIYRVFDMFFTTKAPGAGTGQGLAICKSIVELKHNGKLSVRSKLGAGTTFEASFPAFS